MPGNRAAGFRTVLRCSAARARTSAIGVFACRTRQVSPFTDKQIELASDLRRPGGDRHRECSAVRRGAGKTRDLTESLEQQTATADMLKVISSSPGDLAAGIRKHAGERSRAALVDARNTARCGRPHIQCLRRRGVARGRPGPELASEERPRPRRSAPSGGARGSTRTIEAYARARHPASVATRSRLGGCRHGRYRADASRRARRSARSV